MTQKSDTRKQRDVLKGQLEAGGPPPDSKWEDLEAQYKTQMQMFGQYRELTQMLAHPNIMPFLKDIQKTTNLMKGLASDNNMVFQATQALHAKHAGKTGVAKDFEENFEIIMLYQEYAQQLSQHELLLTPAVGELRTHLAEAVDAAKKDAAEQAAAKEAADLQNRDVVSDVEVKPVQTEKTNEPTA